MLICMRDICASMNKKGSGKWPMRQYGKGKEKGSKSENEIIWHTYNDDVNARRDHFSASTLEKTRASAADAGGFYNDIFVDKLSEENKEITAMHISPGFVATNWGTEMPAPLRAIIRVLQGCCGRSKADCAEFM